jgi:1-acyl-sn-glycerol-3-phosphate acyltransferase
MIDYKNITIYIHYYNHNMSSLKKQLLNYIPRSVKYYFTLIAFAAILQIPCFLSLFASYPLKKIFGVSFPMNISRKLLHYGFKWTNSIFFNTTFIEHPSIEKDKQYVYMANHSSFLDPVVTASMNHTPVSVAIDYAKYVPFLGWNMILMAYPFVKSPPEYVPTGITHMYSKLLNDSDNSDLALSIFPTGKRIFVKDDIDLNDLKSGGFVIAKQTGADIIPVYHNLIDAFNDVTKTYDSDKKVYCVMGEPIKTDGITVQDLQLSYHNSLTGLRDSVEKLKINDVSNS